MSFSFLSSFGFKSASQAASSNSTAPSTSTTTSNSLQNSISASIPSQNSMNSFNATQIQQPQQHRSQRFRQQREQSQPSIITPPSKTAAQVGTAGVWIFLVLDESGSMSSSQQATITAFNDYITQQRDAKIEGQVMVSLMKFEGSNIKMVYDRVDLKEVPALTSQTYVPAGSTNLHDAVGDAMSRIDNKLNESDSLLERSAVFFAVLTDGEENASQHYTGPRIKDMITARRAVGWQFIFLGANIEAADVAERLGISRAAAFQCDTHASSGYSNALQEITLNHRAKCVHVQKSAMDHLKTNSSMGYAQATSMLNSNLNNSDFAPSTRNKYEAPAPKSMVFKQKQQQPQQQQQQPTMVFKSNVQQSQQPQQAPPAYNQLYPQQSPPPPYDQNQMPPAPYPSQQQPQQPQQPPVQL